MRKWPIAVSFVLIFTFGCTYKSPVSIKPGQEIDEYTQGIMHGERDAHGNKKWRIVGCMIPMGMGVLIAEGTDYKPPEHALIGKSPEYVHGYTRSYKNKSRAENTNHAWIGCGYQVCASCIFGLTFVVMYPIPPHNAMP